MCEVGWKAWAFFGCLHYRAVTENEIEMTVSAQFHFRISLTYAHILQYVLTARIVGTHPVL